MFFLTTNIIGFRPRQFPSIHPTVQCSIRRSSNPHFYCSDHAPLDPSTHSCWYIHISLHPSVFQMFRPSVHPFIRSAIPLLPVTLHLFVCVNIRLSVHSSFHVFLHPPTYLFIFKRADKTLYSSIHTLKTSIWLSIY